MEAAKIVASGHSIEQMQLEYFAIANKKQVQILACKV